MESETDYCSIRHANANRKYIRRCPTYDLERSVKMTLPAKRVLGTFVVNSSVKIMAVDTDDVHVQSYVDKEAKKRGSITGVPCSRRRKSRKKKENPTIYLFGVGT